MMMKKYAWLLLLAVPVLFVMGCSGGGGGRIDVDRCGTISSSDIELGDGSFADLVRVRATRDGFIRITMTSQSTNPVNPYVLVYEGSASTFQDLVDLFDAGLLIDSDDDTGPGNAAELIFLAEDNQTYTVALNTSDPGDFGNYCYTIEEIDDDEVVVRNAEPGDKSAAPEAKNKK